MNVLEGLRTEAFLFIKQLKKRVCMQEQNLWQAKCGPGLSPPHPRLPRGEPHMCASYFS